MLLDATRSRFNRRAGGEIIAAVLLALVLVLGVLDQTSKSFVPPYDGLKAVYRNDGDFVRSIERRLPAGSAVYELPYLPFPEAGPLHSDGPLRPRARLPPLARPSLELRRHQGPARRFSPALLAKGLPVVLPRLWQLGFRGIYIDRFGYTDNGASIETALRGLLRV